MVYILDQTVFCLTMIHHRWEYQDCILITKHVNHFFDIGCCCVWSYPYVASFYVSYSSNGNTSFQKQQSSVHFPLQINKFVIVRFTLVFHSILSISLPLFRYILSHNPTYNYRPILCCKMYQFTLYSLLLFPTLFGSYQKRKVFWSRYDSRTANICRVTRVCYNINSSYEMVGRQWNYLLICICVYIHRVLSLCHFYILVYHSAKQKWIWLDDLSNQKVSESYWQQSATGLLATKMQIVHTCVNLASM